MHKGNLNADVFINHGDAVGFPLPTYKPDQGEHAIQVPVVPASYEVKGDGSFGNPYILPDEKGEQWLNHMYADRQAFVFFEYDAEFSRKWYEAERNLPPNACAFPPLLQADNIFWFYDVTNEEVMKRHQVKRYDADFGLSLRPFHSVFEIPLPTGYVTEETHKTTVYWCVAMGTVTPETPGADIFDLENRYPDVYWAKPWISNKAYSCERIIKAQSTDEIFVMMNGALVDFDVEPIMENGRVLVPFRAIIEALGAKVGWDNETETVTATTEDTEIIMQIGTPKITVNGEMTTLDVAPQLVNGRTLVPIRAVSEGLGADVKWSKEKNMVIIITTYSNNSLSIFSGLFKNCFVT